MTPLSKPKVQDKALHKVLDQMREDAEVRVIKSPMEDQATDGKSR